MMGRAEGTACHQPPPPGQVPGDAHYLGHFQGLLNRHLRQDGGEPSGQHGFSGTWRTDEKEIVHSRSGHLHRPFHMGLSPHIGKIIQWRLHLGAGGTSSPVRSGCHSPRKKATVSCSDETGITSIPSTNLASAALETGKITRLKPPSTPAITMDKTPARGRSIPSRASSPTAGSLPSPLQTLDHWRSTLPQQWPDQSCFPPSSDPPGPDWS